jgi:hypothetical protein
MMLTVHFVSGDEMQYPYIELGAVRFNRSKGLKLYFDTATVTIQGVALDTMPGILQEYRASMCMKNMIQGRVLRRIRKKDISRP